MRNDHQTVRTFAAAPRPLLALVLAVCLLVSALPAAWASSVGSGPSSLTRSTAPTYVKLSRSVLIFQGDTYGNGASLTLTVDLLPITKDVSSMIEHIESQPGIHYLKILAQE